MNVSPVNHATGRPESVKRISILGIQEFWRKVRSSENRLLALDYDGTLAPFHKDPMKAYPLPGVIETLRRLKKASGTTVAIISGRPVYELLALLGYIGVELIGCHGFESMSPYGNVVVRSPSPRQFEGLEIAEMMLPRRDSTAWIEIKIASIALHTRGMEAAEASEIEEQAFHRWALMASTYDLECRRFNGGVELRAKGLHKGDALGTVLSRQPEGTLTVYIGDDETDEDAFRVVRDHGVGIRVGEPTPRTLATEFLHDCREVKEFLESWVENTVEEGSGVKSGNA
jgi:trehalose-phosphatase